MMNDMITSGAYDESGLGIGGYDWIHADQIGWYLSSLAEAEQNIPAMAFFHIPLTEW